MLPGDVDETKIDEGCDTCSFGGRGVGSASPALRVVDVEVGRDDIEGKLQQPGIGRDDMGRIEESGSVGTT